MPQAEKHDRLALEAAKQRNARMLKRPQTASRRLRPAPDRMFHCDTTASKAGDLITLLGNELAQDIFAFS